MRGLLTIGVIAILALCAELTAKATIDDLLAVLREGKSEGKSDIATRIESLDRFIAQQPSDPSAVTAKLLKAFLHLQKQTEEDANISERLFREVIAAGGTSWEAQIAQIGVVGVLHAQGRHAELIRDAQYALRDVSPNTIKQDAAFKKIATVYPIQVDELLGGVRAALQIAESRTELPNPSQPTQSNTPQSKPAPQTPNSLAPAPAPKEKPTPPPPIESPTASAEPEAEKPNTLLFVLLGLVLVAVVFVVLRKARNQ